jgi:SAM-dependent methyltransferase
VGSRVSSLSHAADGALRALVYTAAGLMTPARLSALITRRWSEFGADRDYILSGLQPWEADVYQRTLRRDDHVLIVGCGSGREVIALRREGYRADGLEPAAPAVARARAMLAELGVEGTIHVGCLETAPPAGTWDACVFSWRCYSYIPERGRRLAALHAARQRLSPRGRIVLSYVHRATPVRRLPRAISAAAAWLTRSRRRPEATDVISLTAGGLHFEHQFVPGEVESEARDARLSVIEHHGGEEEVVVLAAAE